MSVDPNRKTLRHFYCRDTLWQSFERMSEDLDRGIDDLVNEAMRIMARDKGYLPTESEGPRQPGSRPKSAPAQAAPPPPPRRMTPPPPPPPRNTLAATASLNRSAGPALPAPAERGPAMEAPGGMEAAAPPLYLLFQSQKFLVDKEQFIIGRGSKSSDLPIRDGNISRKHAAVVRRNGSYFIKDLGSTNGIDYNGVRIDNKRIEEGDVFNICDYELRFTFR